MTMDFFSANDFELLLEKAQDGEISIDDLLRGLIVAELAVPCANEVMEDGSGFQPLLFSRSGVPMVACFSDKERIGDFSTMAPYCLVMKGRDVLRRLSPGYGLVVNPGRSLGFDITPEGVEKIVREFAT